jgi:type VII secretion-associated protein (TIGR03931 family)
MTGIVVEVGPAIVRGPNHADAEWVSAGIDGIDDELILIDDRPVEVADVWRTVMHDVVGGSAETIVIVCPTWWSSSRVERVRDAASTVANDVVVLRRAQALRDGQSDRPLTVVEIARSSWSCRRLEAICRCWRVETRKRFGQDADADGGCGRQPRGRRGACPLAAAIADRLRANGVAVTIADQDWVWRGAEVRPPQEEARCPEARPPTNRSGRATAVLTGTLVSAAVLCGGFAGRDDAHPSAANVPMTLLIEGRVGVMVPAQWVVERVTSGPGSARVQVVSPNDPDIAVHVTQSSLAPHQSHEQVAESMRSALSHEPDGVFVEFNPSDRQPTSPW